MDSFTMSNTSSFELPPLPAYTLTPRPSMIPGIPDIWAQLVAPIIAYWVVSGFFHILDTFDFFSQYRLHTPAELLKRNHVTRFDVLRDVILQQIIQTITGYAFSYFDPPEMIGMEQYDIAVWAQRLRRAQTHLPQFLALLGFDAPKFAGKVYSQSPALASVLSGGQYSAPNFTTLEMTLAKGIYWVGIPLVQFTIAIIIVDTWQYFLHRAMHMNKFLYTWLHSRHHRLYVPYAFGALYNHPIEGFMLDTLGTGMAYIVTGMTIRQGMWFFTCSTIKTVDDHCGYHFPWDPLQHVTSNNAAYHDVHHQSWGVKVNFSQPFFTFWDRVLNTTWAGGDVSARYERARLIAQKKVDADKAKVATDASITNSPAVDLDLAAQQAQESQEQVLASERGRQILQEEAREEAETKRQLRRSPRRRTSTFDAKSLSDKVSGSLYGRRTPVLKADGMH